MSKIYLDYAATAYVDDQVIETMIPYFKNHFGNPSGIYESGREAKAALENAREALAHLLHAQYKNEIYFTSCGTESDNWAIKGAAYANKGKGRHIVTTQTEHHAVLHACEHLQKDGFDVTYLAPDQYGMVSPAQVAGAIRSDTILVSVIYANNEVGTINPINEIAKAVKQKGVLFHTDAVQAAGVLPIDVLKSNVDLLSISAHKFYGPKGIGLLYSKNGVKLESILHGGGQERNKRSGTENVPYIAGMAKALQLACEQAENENARLTSLRDYMIEEIKKRIPYTTLNGHPTKRLPGNVNMSLECIEAEASLLSLDLAGIECSSGSACASGSQDASHVLLAMGVRPDVARSALRFTFGRTTTREQLDYTIDQLEQLSCRLRNLSPLFAKRKGEVKNV